MVDPTRPTESSRVKNDEPQQQEQAPQKATPSAFDEVLRQSRQIQTPQQQQGAQQGASVLQRQAEVRERPQGDRGRSGQDRKESGEERRSGEGESGRTEGPREGRVEAKPQQRDREGGGQGQGQFGGGRGAMTREAGQSKSKEGTRSAHALTQGTFAEQLKKVDVPHALSAQHIQQIVNKVLQYFRMKKLKDGATEIELGFHEEIFKGLRLRLVQKGGKVSLHIRTGEGDVRRLFEKSRGAIEKALTDKGIQLSEIVIGTG